MRSLFLVRMRGRAAIEDESIEENRLMGNALGGQEGMNGGNLSDENKWGRGKRIKFGHRRRGINKKTGKKGRVYNRCGGERLPVIISGKEKKD